MKRLSDIQIQQIEQQLIDQYNIKYTETRCEIIDHIACEIETLMHNDVIYADAYNITFDKWDKSLKPHHWIRYNDMPWFLIKTWLKRDLTYYALTAIVGITLPLLLLNTIREYNLSSPVFATFIVISFIIATLIYYSHRKKENYRLSFLTKNAIMDAIFTLVLLIRFSISTNDLLMISLAFTMTLMQVYNFIEAKKIKVYTIS